MIDVAFACTACGKPVEGALTVQTRHLVCAGCAHPTPLAGAPQVAARGRVDECPVCGSKDLYAQRDFNRRLGLALAAVGLLLGPFTSWISVLVAVGADAVLYALVPSVVICYACNAQYRGVAKDERPEGFEIAIHDAYKFGKRFPPRREAAVAGPLARRLRLEGRQPS